MGFHGDHVNHVPCAAVCGNRHCYLGNDCISAIRVYLCLSVVSFLDFTKIRSGYLLRVKSARLGNLDLMVTLKNDWQTFLVYI